MDIQALLPPPDLTYGHMDIQALLPPPDLTAESDTALLQQRRLVDKLGREELEDRWGEA